jgi:hypothetical protein
VDETDRERRLVRWTLVGFVVVVIVAPLVIRSRPVPVLSLSVVVGVLAMMAGVAAARIRIRWTHGKPFGDRDPLRDATSPLLRSGQGRGLLLSIGMILTGVAGLAFAVYWYPRPDPFDRDLIVSGRRADPADYILAPLLLVLAILGLGTYLTITTLYWRRVVRQSSKGV